MVGFRNITLKKAIDLREGFRSGSKSNHFLLGRRGLAATSLPNLSPSGFVTVVILKRSIVHVVIIDPTMKTRGYKSPSDLLAKIDATGALLPAWRPAIIQLLWAHETESQQGVPSSKVGPIQVGAMHTGLRKRNMVNLVRKWSVASDAPSSAEESASVEHSSERHWSRASSSDLDTDPDCLQVTLTEEFVELVDSEQSAKCFIEFASLFRLSGGVAAFDVEWGDVQPVALVQLALAPHGSSAVTVFLLDLLSPIAVDVKSSLRDVLLSSSSPGSTVHTAVTVLAFSPSEDLRRLQEAKVIIWGRGRRVGRVVAA